MHQIHGWYRTDSSLVDLIKIVSQNSIEIWWSMITLLLSLTVMRCIMISFLMPTFWTSAISSIYDVKYNEVDNSDDAFSQQHLTLDQWCDLHAVFSKQVSLFERSSFHISKDMLTSNQVHSWCITAPCPYPITKKIIWKRNWPHDLTWHSVTLQSLHVGVDCVHHS